MRAFEMESRLNVQTAFNRQRAALAENAQLYQKLQEREVQLRNLLGQLVTAQEGERQRIARELHDETGQKLTALGMGLAAVDAQLRDGSPGAATGLVTHLREVNDQAIVELRNIMADLRPAQLDDLGLTPALRWYVKQYQTRHPELAVHFAPERTLSRLPAQLETVLFRVAQEALTNVARHAQATRVTVNLRQTETSATLEVQDDGVGFNPQRPGARPGVAVWVCRGCVSASAWSVAAAPSSRRPDRAHASSSNFPSPESEPTYDQHSRPSR